MDFATYLWNVFDFDVYKYLSENSGQLFSTTGCLYGPLRNYVSIQNIEARRVLIFVRDPRDVLVSHYFSMGISHNLPVNQKRRHEFLLERRRINSLSINEYVLQASPQFQGTYRSYANLLQCGGTMLRYEDLMENPYNWIKQFICSLGLTPTEKSIRDLIKLGQFKEPVSENAALHVRQKLPGDHIKKLHEGTIEQLNSIWRSELGVFGYR